MSVMLSLEQSYSLLRKLGSFLQTPLVANQKIGISNQEVVVLHSSSPIPDNLEQLHPLVSCAAKNIIDELRNFLPLTGGPREKITLINEKLTTLTNAWSTLHTLSKTCYVNDPRVNHIFNRTIHSIKENYHKGRFIYYHYLQEANQSVPEEHRWLFAEQVNTINNLRENNNRLRERRDSQLVKLREAASEQERMQARLKDLAAENGAYRGQIEALEFSTEVVVHEKALQEALQRSNSTDLAQALVEAQSRLSILQTETSSRVSQAIEIERRQASSYQQELVAERERTSNLQTELYKARARLQFIFLFISTVSAITLFFSRRKRS